MVSPELKFIRILALSLLVISLSGCLQESDEVVPPDEQEVIRHNSQLAESILKITLLDGSEDNILDNASCLTVDYPVEVKLKNIRLTLESADDLPMLKELYAQEIAVRSQFKLSFPIKVILSDYQTITVRNQRELDLLAAQCIEGGGDEDIECLDFSYPVQLATYDVLNQLADTKTFSSDESLFYFFRNVGEDDLISFRYPIRLTIYTGDEVIINNQEELENTILEFRNACDERDTVFHNEGLNLQTGYLRVMLTDAPYPSDLMSEVLIAVSKLEIKRKAGPAGDTSITIFEGNETINLLDLTNGITAILAEEAIPKGNYQHLELYISTAKVIMKDGEEFDLVVPGGAEAGITIVPKPSLNVQQKDTTDILLDFDVSRSFIPQGNLNSPEGITGFVLVPVIHAVVLHKTGRLHGSVTEASASIPLDDVQVTIFDEDGLPYTSTFTNADGQFKVLGLLPGNYTVQAERNGYVRSSIHQINIAAQEIAEKHFVLQAE